MFAEYGVLNYWTYLVGAIFIVLVPGPNTLFVLKNSVSSLRCIYWRCGIDVSGMGWSGDIN